MNKSIFQNSINNTPLNTIFSFLYFSNLWVALNISILAILGAEIFNIKYNYTQAINLFLLAWISYTWPLFITTLSPHFTPITSKEIYFSKHKKTISFIIISIILFEIFSLIYLKIFDKNIFNKLIILGFCTSLYIIPFLNTGIRQINFIKIIYISLSWAFISILYLPLYSKETIIYFIFQTCIIFLITLPFDKKDILIDAKLGLKTFENSFSSKQLIFIKLFLTAIILICLQYMSINITHIGFVSFILLLIPFSKKTWYFVLLDGIPFFQFIIFKLMK
ncbi:MAG: hypothetical protein RLZZ175_286 [Bacteroidota bacterium]|jgi:hypothetical protein